MLRQLEQQTQVMLKIKNLFTEYSTTVSFYSEVTLTCIGYPVRLYYHVCCGLPLRAFDRYDC